MNLGLSTSSKKNEIRPYREEKVLSMRSVHVLSLLKMGNLKNECLQMIDNVNLNEYNKIRKG